MFFSDSTIETIAAWKAQKLKDCFQKPKEDWRMRPSSLGHQICKLQWEKLDPASARQDDLFYTFPLKMMMGHDLEATLLGVMLEAKLPIDSVGEEVTIDLGVTQVKGTLDLIIDGKVYDIKSASHYSFAEWEKKGLNKLLGHDPFGYLVQLYLYADAKGLPAGGWYVAGKSDSKILEILIPSNDKGIREDALSLARKHAKRLLETLDESHVDRQFPPLTETWYGKPTGRKVVNTESHACQYCPFKAKCHGAKLEKGPGKEWRWYVD